MKVHLCTYFNYLAKYARWHSLIHLFFAVYDKGSSFVFWFADSDNEERIYKKQKNKKKKKRRHSSSEEEEESSDSDGSFQKKKKV